MLFKGEHLTMYLMVFLYDVDYLNYLGNCLNNNELAYCWYFKKIEATIILQIAQ